MRYRMIAGAAAVGAVSFAGGLFVGLRLSPNDRLPGAAVVGSHLSSSPLLLPDSALLNSHTDRLMPDGISTISNLASEPDVAFFPAAINDQHESADMNGESRAIWEKQLKHLPNQAVQEILQLRNQLGSVAAESLGIPAVIKSSAEPGLLQLPADGSLKPLAAHPDEPVSSEN